MVRTAALARWQEDTPICICLPTRQVFCLEWMLVCCDLCSRDLIKGLHLAAHLFNATLRVAHTQQPGRRISKRELNLQCLGYRLKVAPDDAFRPFPRSGRQPHPAPHPFRGPLQQENQTADRSSESEQSDKGKASAAELATLRERLLFGQPHFWEKVPTGHEGSFSCVC